MPHSLDQKIAALLEQETALRNWLEQIRALTRDDSGCPVIAGLSPAETEEFLRLSPRVQAHDSGMTGADFRAASARHAELKATIEAALQEDAIESLSSWGERARA